jgi:hypothetical protein
MIMVTVPLEWWDLLVGTLLPAIVALVRDRYGSSRLGALLLVGLTALAAVLGEIGSTFDAGDAAQRFVILFVIAVVTHYGLLQPAGITGRKGVITTAVPGGIGGGTPPPPAP